MNKALEMDPNWAQMHWAAANLLLMKRISETLAGRAGYITLWPLTRRERLGLGCAGIWTRFFDTLVKDWFDVVREENVPVED